MLDINAITVTIGRVNWDAIGEKEYETGVDHGVLYRQDNTGAYVMGVAWNGLTSVTESPTGAEPSPFYADNIKYGNIMGAEEFGATIEAYMYPKLFEECDGTAELAPGVTIGQQSRKFFGFCYRTLKGNDVQNTDFGYKIHLVYGCLAAPSEKAYGTVNESSEAITFGWELTTTPVPVPGFKPTATLVFDSTETDATKLAALEEILYGSEAAAPRLPLPAEIAAIMKAAG